MGTRRAPLALLACAVLTIRFVQAQIQVTPLLVLDRETSEPSLSPDGKTLAFDWCKPDYSCGIYTRQLAGGDVHLLVGKDSKEGTPYSLRWSPDGKKIAFTRFYSHYDSHLFVSGSTGSAELDLGSICGPTLESGWTPDSRYLVASTYAEDPPKTFRCRPTLFSTETGLRVRRMALTGDAASFSPNGRMLAYANGKALMLLRLTRDYLPIRPAAVLTREPNEIEQPSWTPDGKQIIYGVWGDVPYLRRTTLTPSTKPQTIPGISKPLSIAQLLADGSALATETTQVEALWRADLRSTPSKVEIVADPGCSAGEPGCSLDGRIRASITKRTGLWQIWLANPDGTGERPLVKSIPAFANPGDDGVPSQVVWSPDGKWIAFTVFPAHGNADVRSHLYVVPSSGGGPRRLGAEAYALYNPAWSRDSRSLYASQGWSSEDQAHDLKSPIVRVDIADGKLAPLGADGMWPRVSSDQKFVYFFTQPSRNLSRVPVGGGAPERLRDQGDLLWFCYAVGDRYLYFFQEQPRSNETHTQRIIRFDPESREMRELADIPFGPRFAYLSPDEHFLYFGQQEDPKQRVVLVRGLF